MVENVGAPQLTPRAPRNLFEAILGIASSPSEPAPDADTEAQAPHSVFVKPANQRLDPSLEPIGRIPARQ
jgi:hypothetical protein